jgi:DNA mismatch repair protein MutL
MSFRIVSLPLETVHLIAAGEVIDSLSAVVRELVENGIDAKATRITLSLWPEQWRIQVADNGIGMVLADLEQAAFPHSTSKIRSHDDLGKISSLGFRGEALHSLAQLADLKIASRPIASRSMDLMPSAEWDCDRPLDLEGWYITYDHFGQPSQTEPVAIAPGTIVTVEQLFANLPARRQAFPSLAQQLRAVQATIQQMALCHPEITWHLRQNDRDWFSVFPGNTARNVLPQILRDVQISDLQELWIDFPTIGPDLDLPASLYLLLGLPDRCHRHRPDWIKVGINGRLVHLSEIEQTILASFRRTLLRDRYPICFVHLHVPTSEVDWNRHPAKTEIYLHHLAVWQERVAAAIDQALRLNPASVPHPLYTSRISQLLKTAEAESAYRLGQQEARSGSQKAGVNVSEARGLAGFRNIETRQEGEEGEQGVGSGGAGEGQPVKSKGGGQAEKIEDKSQKAEDQSKIQNPKSKIPSFLKAIAQVHNMYILAEHPTGIWLIEQHIAHERVLYEQLCDRWQLVPLSPPIILNHLAIAQVEQLQRIQIEVEPFGEDTWIVRSAPALLAKREDCAAALLELSLGGNLSAAQAATACRSAIRNGTPLTLPEMQSLLEQWQQTRHPHTCPHGRPICLTLQESSLSRFFRRHWMIGKSHGI